MFFLVFPGGAKNYAYKTNSGKTCCKVRGFTLNFRNSENLNYEMIKRFVTSMDETITIPLVNPAKIVRDAKSIFIYYGIFMNICIYYGSMHPYMCGGSDVTRGRGRK